MSKQLVRIWINIWTDKDKDTKIDIDINTGIDINKYRHR